MASRTSRSFGFQNATPTNPRSIGTPWNTPFLRDVPSLAQVNNKESERKDFTSSTAKDSIPALQTQVRHWINDTPRSLLERGWLIVDICGRLRGRYRQHPHPTKVAQILRMLGWQQVRSWTKDACGRRIWYPPADKS